MEAILFPLVAIALYFIADWILQRIEVSMGRRLENRTLVFFALLLTLAVGTFSVIQRLLDA